MTRRALSVCAASRCLNRPPSRWSASTAASTATGATRVPDLPVPFGDWCARDRSGGLLRGGGGAASCPQYGPLATTGFVRAVSVHVFGANFGAGWPTIIAVHLEHTSTAVVTAATLLSIGFAVVLVRAAASFLPQRSADAEDRALPASRKASVAS